MMQYLRLIPAKFGLINKAAFHLQIKRINPDDTFILSYPKSGNTWVRFIISYMIKGTDQTITFDDLETIVPEAYRSQDFIDSQKSNRFIKTHDLFFDDYPYIIYIYRDYRDVLVSLYHFQMAWNIFTGSFAQFIRHGLKNLHNHGTWQDHIKGALACKEKNPGKILMVSYEKLLDDFYTEALKIAQFCHLDIDNIDFDMVEQKTSFDEIKENENENGSRFMRKTKQNFAREGKAGVWKDVFTKDDLDYLYQDQEIVGLLKKLNYPLVQEKTVVI